MITGTAAGGRSDSLQVAARLNLSSWRSERLERYVTFVSKREQGHASNYFREFIGCDVTADPRTESKKFVAVLQEFIAERKAAGVLAEDDGVARLRHVFDHITKADRGTPVSLDEITKVVWPENEVVFTSFLNAHNASPVDQFYPDTCRTGSFSKPNEGRRHRWLGEYSSSHCVTGIPHYLRHDFSWSCSDDRSSSTELTLDRKAMKERFPGQYKRVNTIYDAVEARASWVARYPWVLGGVLLLATAFTCYAYLQLPPVSAGTASHDVTQQASH
ncbi:nucleoid-associated protein [Luteibacter yeojuensis]|uniref:nucleoid-associated protein n=1 Tax=Luteibacter yeojuensis TaxID=345309 RepID=UPI000A6D64A6|nr:nucleoid-associated protein [Luteibacter yeojuensis]